MSVCTISQSKHDAMLLGKFTQWKKGSHSVGCSKVYAIVEICIEIRHMIRFTLPKDQKSNTSGTSKRIQDTRQISSYFNFLSQYLTIIVDLHLFCKNVKLFLSCFYLQNWQNNFRCTSNTKHINQILALLKKVWICLAFFLLYSIQEIHINESQASICVIWDWTYQPTRFICP